MYVTRNINENEYSVNVCVYTKCFDALTLSSCSCSQQIFVKSLAILRSGLLLIFYFFCYFSCNTENDFYWKKDDKTTEARWCQLKKIWRHFLSGGRT